MSKKILSFMLLSSVWLQIQASDQNNQLSRLNKDRLAHVIMMNAKSRKMVSKYNEYFGQFTCDENQEQEIQEIRSLCDQNLSMGELMLETVKQDPADLDAQWVAFIAQVVHNSDTIIHRTCILEPFLEESKYADID